MLLNRIATMATITNSIWENLPFEKSKQLSAGGWYLQVGYFAFVQVVRQNHRRPFGQDSWGEIGVNRALWRLSNNLDLIILGPVSLVVLRPLSQAPFLFVEPCFIDGLISILSRFKYKTFEKTILLANFWIMFCTELASSVLWPLVLTSSSFWPSFLSSSWN